MVRRIKRTAREAMLALKGCAALSAQETAQVMGGKLVKADGLQRTRVLHSHMLRDFELDVFVFNSIIDLYAKCGSMEESSRVFHKMPCHSMVSWNTLLLGYAENGDEQLALEIFWFVSAVEFLSSRTFVATLRACTKLAGKETGETSTGNLVKLESLATGMELHSRAVACGCVDTFVANSLIDMYGSCGSPFDAARVFDTMPERDVISWTAIVAAFSGNGDVEIALALFLEMVEQGCQVDVGALVTALKACMGVAVKEVGELVHGKLVKVESLEKTMGLHFLALTNGCDANVFVSNTLVDLYSKCGSLLDSRGLFDRMKLQSPVSWTSLLLGYVEDGQAQLSLDLFFCLLSGSALEPDAQAFVAALKACGSLADLQRLSFVHGAICRCGLETEPLLANSLVDVYGRCGSVTSAHHLFDCLATTDSATWNGLIASYSRHGRNKAVLELFHAMREQGMKPDDVTSTCLLAACSHQGLVEQGKRYFGELVKRKQGSGHRPRVEHYDCMVDLLGRANQLEAAVELARSVPCADASVVTWTTVLAASQRWKNEKVARTAFEALERLNARESSSYMLMANVLNATGSFVPTGRQHP